VSLPLSFRATGVAVDLVFVPFGGRPRFVVLVVGGALEASSSSFETTRGGRPRFTGFSAAVSSTARASLVSFTLSAFCAAGVAWIGDGWAGEDSSSTSMRSSPLGVASPCPSVATTRGTEPLTCGGESSSSLSSSICAALGVSRGASAGEAEDGRGRPLGSMPGVAGSGSADLDLVLRGIDRRKPDLTPRALLAIGVSVAISST
jgi:hypothetical protein